MKFYLDEVSVCVCSQENTMCYCGNEYSSIQVSDMSCNYLCSADLDDVCGGHSIAGIYSGEYVYVYPHT